MSGYATFVTTTATSTAVPTPQPTSTEGDGTEDLPEEDGGEGGETETEPKPTVVPTPTPTVAPPVTTSSKDGTQTPPANEGIRANGSWNSLRSCYNHGRPSDQYCDCDHRVGRHDEHHYADGYRREGQRDGHCYEERVVGRGCPAIRYHIRAARTDSYCSQL
ncbi:hypothetical protein FA13DRAFT_1750775 [Coprinellus micaceus]|uniref:Uncharacterized protein n=1 Tax=Coprinellus micaceus TaxID=71717 RepID=A0A4Y7R5V0_COPMI|nr:hypothetical protein FA13DRAFT_1750775 [Coprinellus micaceus]